MDPVANGENIAINPTAPVPEIKIEITSVAIGYYSAYLVQAQDHPLICQGSSQDPVKSCPIGTTSSDLPGHKVTWQVGIYAPGANDLFKVTVTITQDGGVLRQYAYNGKGDDMIIDFVRVVAQ